MITISYAQLRTLTNFSTKSLQRLFHKHQVPTHRISNRRFVYIYDLQKIPSFGESVLLLLKCDCGHEKTCPLHLNDELRDELKRKAIK